MSNVPLKFPLSEKQIERRLYELWLDFGTVMPSLLKKTGLNGFKLNDLIEFGTNIRNVYNFLLKILPEDLQINHTRSLAEMQHVLKTANYNSSRGKGWPYDKSRQFKTNTLF